MERLSFFGVLRTDDEREKYVRKIARRRVLDGDVMTIIVVRKCVLKELDRITRAGADSAVIADIQTKLHACALLQTVMEREIEKRWALGFFDPSMYYSIPRYTDTEESTDEQTA